MSDNPFWPRPARIPSGPRPGRVEVLVVGGGITGVSLLRRLGERGVKAALAERKQLAFGASGRNAGFLLEGTAANYADAVAAHGGMSHARCGISPARTTGGWPKRSAAEQATTGEAPERGRRHPPKSSGWRSRPS